MWYFYGCNLLHHRPFFFLHSASQIHLKGHNVTVCNETLALEGKGVAVKWPSSVYGYTQYSRLVHSLAAGGSSKSNLLDHSNQPDKVNGSYGGHCVYVNETRRHLWMLSDCVKDKFWGLCVKRKCFWPIQTG